MNVSSTFFTKISFQKNEFSSLNENILDDVGRRNIRTIYPSIDFGRAGNQKVPVQIEYVNSFSNGKITIVQCTCKLLKAFTIVTITGVFTGALLAFILGNLYASIYPITIAFIIFFTNFKSIVRKQVILAIRKFEQK